MDYVLFHCKRPGLTPDLAPHLERKGCIMATTDVRERYGPGDPHEAVTEKPPAPALTVADPAPLGLAAFALTTFMLSGHCRLHP